jgi:hypothetical protein
MPIDAHDIPAVTAFPLLIPSVSVQATETVEDKAATAEKVLRLSPHFPLSTTTVTAHA